jgi:hypothetical protein
VTARTASASVRRQHRGPRERTIERRNSLVDDARIDAVSAQHQLVEREPLYRCRAAPPSDEAQPESGQRADRGAERGDVIEPCQRAGQETLRCPEHEPMAGPIGQQNTAEQPHVVGHREPNGADVALRVDPQRHRQRIELARDGCRGEHAALGLRGAARGELHEGRLVGGREVRLEARGSSSKVLDRQHRHGQIRRAQCAGEASIREQQHWLGAPQDQTQLSEVAFRVHSACRERQRDDHPARHPDPQDGCAGVERVDQEARHGRPADNATRPEVGGDPKRAGPPFVPRPRAVAAVCPGGQQRTARAGRFVKWPPEIGWRFTDRGHPAGGSFAQLTSPLAWPGSLAPDRNVRLIVPW